MFTWVKKLFGTESASQAVVARPQTVAVVAPAPAAVTVKTETKKSVANAAKHTKASLGKLTKADIEKIAKAEFGVDIDRRKTKDDMIKDFLAEQKK